MKLKDFEKVLKEYISIDESVDRLNKALREFDPDFNYLIFSRYKELFFDTITSAMDDKDDWIGYFLYEMDAKFSKKPIGKHKNGKKLYIRDYKDLYKLIK